MSPWLRYGYRYDGCIHWRHLFCYTENEGYTPSLSSTSTCWGDQLQVILLHRLHRRHWTTRIWRPWRAVEPTTKIKRVCAQCADVPVYTLLTRRAFCVNKDHATTLCRGSRTHPFPGLQQLILSQSHPSQSFQAAAQTVRSDTSVEVNINDSINAITN